MSNKELRILIAEEKLKRIIHIERLLNRLNYYRIAPVQTLEELLTLTAYASEHFDLLIVSKQFSARAGVDVEAFCRDRPQILNALIYESKNSQHIPVLVYLCQSVYVCLSHTPDSGSMKDFMRIIDPPSV